MTKKILFSFLAALATCFSYAQTISYQIEIYQLGWEGRSDQSGDPEYTYHVWATDNQVGATETGGQCIYTGDDYGPAASNGFVSCAPGGTLFGSGINIRNEVNVPNSTTTALIRFEAFEKDCSNNCFFVSSCGFLGSLEDDDHAQCNNYSVNFRSSPPCVWTDYPVQSCGTFSYGVRIKWWYEGILGGNIGSNQSFCGSGDPSTLNNTSLATGDPYTTYQWQSSPDGVTFTNIPGANSKDYDPPAVTTTTYFRRKATACTSGATAFSNNVVVTISSPLVTPPVAADQSFCGTFDPVLIGGPASTGTACIVYTWEESADGIIWGTAVANSAALTYDPPVISGATRYYRRRADISCGSGNPAGCASYSNIVTVRSVTPITNNVISGDQTLCDYGDPTLLSGTVPSGGALNVYQWQSSPDGLGSWTDIFGANSQNFDPPPTGTSVYYRRIITSPPCSSTSNVISVLVTPAITNNVIATNIYQRFCQSGDPAVITASTPSGGTGSYTYAWEISINNGATWTPAPGVNNGINYDPGVTSVTTEYRRRVTSGVCALEMTTYARVLILSLPTISSVTSSNVSCFGGNDGTINVSASSTNGNVTFSNNNGGTYQVSGTFSGLTAGNYNVVVQDDSLCSRPYVGNPVVISEPPLLTLVTVKQDASCASVFDGSITATPTGGTANYTYTLNSGPSQPNNVFSGLSAGTYTVEVTDSKGCKATSSITIGNSYIISANLDSSKNVSCFGGNDGAIYVSLTGGIAPYSYSIDGFIFQPLSSFTGLTSGNYTITLRDSKGCTEYLPVTITQPAQVSVILDSITNVSCAGTGTGGIYITTTGGTAPYTYVWTNGSTNEDLTNVNAGTYNVAITDSKGCTGNAGATITQPLPLFVTLAQSSNVLCKGDSTGYIDITVSGGVPRYTFVWNTSDTSEDLSNLVGGNYAVTVTDANGCQKFLSHTITEPVQALTVVLSKTDATCNGAADGTATATVSGGTSPYTYLWSNNATTNSISGLVAGAYFVTVQDANGCSIVQSISITQPNPFVISGTVTDVDCKGQTTGAINVTVAPAGVYTYTWSSPSAIGQNPAGLAAGTYTVTVNLTSNPGCTVAKTFTIAEPVAALVLNLAGFDSVKCAGSNSGFIDITANGGTPSYAYVWNKNGSAFATTEDLSNLSTGSYAVTVTDSKGCTAQLTQNISNPVPISSLIVKTDLNCHGDQNGTATLTVSGGKAPYTYLWSNFQGSQNISQLSGGLYFVVITDANGCEKRDSVIINEPTQVKLSLVSTNISCFNANDGTIDLTVTGGTPLAGSPSYTYAWSHGPTTEDVSGLSQATYAVTVRDANLCSATASALIVNPPAINSIVVITDPLCNVANGNNSGGGVNVGVSGGTPGYTYQWSNGASTSSISNLTGGVYVVTISDSRLCTKVDSAVVVEPDPIVYNVFTKNVSCKDNKDGFLDITAYGGTQPYSFVWSNGNLTEDVGGLPGGNYTVNITDKNGCTAQGFFNVKEPDSLRVSITKTDATCQGANTGSVHAIATGGTLQYNYLWSNFSFDSIQNNIPGGTYSVVVTDSNQCKASATATVNGQPSIMSVTKSVSNPKCFGADNGFVSLAVTGGAQPYVYNWNTTPAQNGSVATTLASGTYIVTITDKSGCSINDTTQLTDPAALVVTANGLNQASCANTSDGIVVVNVVGGRAPFIYQYNGFVQSSDTFRGIGPGVYSVLARDANGCEATTVSTINALGQVTVDLTSDKEVILATQPVQLLATAISDTFIKQYIWTPLSGGFDYSGCADSTVCNNPIARPHQTTTFVVTAIDERGCSATDTLQIEVSNDKSYFMPTAFTPNADGLNDFFEFDVLGAVSFEVNIWNRWGEKVFSNPNQKNGIAQSAVNGAWDGTFRGKKVQFDTYTYQIVVKYFDGTTENKAGTITVMQ